jgi:hypothetical protein
MLKGERSKVRNQKGTGVENGETVNLPHSINVKVNGWHRPNGSSPPAPSQQKKARRSFGNRSRIAAN